MRKLTKISAVIGGGALVIATAGAAYAYWTATGSGTGTAATSAGVNGVTFTQGALSQMYPGDSAQTIAGTINNVQPAGGQHQYVTQVVVSLASVDATHATAGCSISDYTLTGATVPVGVDIAANSSTALPAGASVKFNNKVTNQDFCKGATLNLAYAIS